MTRRRLLVGVLLLLCVAGLGLAAPLDTPLVAWWDKPMPPTVRERDPGVVFALQGPVAVPGQTGFMAVEPNGTVVAADRTNRQVLRVGADGRLLSTWGPSLDAKYELKDLGGVATTGSRWYVLDRGEPPGVF